MSKGFWGELQHISPIRDLMVSFRKAHDASPTIIRRTDPKSYIAHHRRRAHTANEAHQRPGVGDGLS